MTTSTTQIKKKRGRPPLSAAKKMQRNKAAQNARAVHKALRKKITFLKAGFKERLRVAEAYQRALEKVVKIERKKMEANYKALAVAKAKFGKKPSKASQRMMMAGRRGRPSQISLVKGTVGMRKRGRPRKTK